ncbi:uncharacterized protein HGUI_03026 [Hanseniaspora guilliermondii]|uniref:Mannosyltransferase n=1 Tax=Hanseniaspora guilliermondii TaxID=56406 RepID=A0A1L0B360_9ASCO|nr:uncharacterized protein HGUI_03026 [Hanseniaspora guilliermondii]
MAKGKSSGFQPSAEQKELVQELVDLTLKDREFNEDGELVYKDSKYKNKKEIVIEEVIEELDTEVKVTPKLEETQFDEDTDTEGISWYTITPTSYLLILFAFLHMFYSPYTKVEELFNMQAIHDILKYGIFDISKYDHIKYSYGISGSFIPPLIIATLMKPFVYFGIIESKTYSLTQMSLQFGARGILAVMNILSIVFFKNCVQIKLLNQLLSPNNFGFKRKGNAARKSIYSIDEDSIVAPSSSLSYWVDVFLLGQFHLMYYCSRSLPNFIMAFAVSNVAFGLIAMDKFNIAIFLLAFGGMVFNFELFLLGIALLLAQIITESHFTNEIDLTHFLTTAKNDTKDRYLKICKHIAFGIALGASLSFIIDSYFWGHSTLPEVETFLINRNIGMNAGEPLHAYFTKYLLIFFLPPTILALNYYGLQYSYDNFKMFFVLEATALIYMFIMSLKPHKEWRFIAYIVPIMLVIGANGCSFTLININYKDPFGIIVPILISVSPIVSLFISIVFSYLGSKNYPGGVALAKFNEHILNDNTNKYVNTNITVHMDPLTCMTGATLFGEIDLPSNYSITYDKTQDPQEIVENWGNYDFLIGQYYEELNDLSEFNYTLIGKASVYGGINGDHFETIRDKYKFENLYDIVRYMIEHRSVHLLKDLFDGIIKYEDVIFIWERDN